MLRPFKSRSEWWKHVANGTWSRAMSGSSEKLYLSGMFISFSVCLYLHKFHAGLLVPPRPKYLLSAGFSLSTLLYLFLFLIMMTLPSFRPNTNFWVSFFCPRLALYWLSSIWILGLNLQALGFWAKILNFGLVFTDCSNSSVLVFRLSFPLDSNLKVGCILCLNYFTMPHKTLC